MTKALFSLWFCVVTLGFFARGASAQIIVGDGSAASCTDVAVRKALTTATITGGGTIGFQCGGDPVTIPLLDADPAALTIPSNTTVDGNGLISLQLSSHATRASPLVFVAFNSVAALKALTFTGPSNTHYVINAGTLTVSNSTFVRSSAGAIANSGELTIVNGTFSENTNFTVGGAISNDGNLTVISTAFIGNGAFDSSGGAIFNANQGTLDVTHSLF
jgi:hypothetical protein